MSHEHLFEAFWLTAGREESRNRLNDWREVDGRWASIGWMHFSQGHSIHLLMKEAFANDPDQFNAAFGAYAPCLANERWVRSTNLNEPTIKPLLVGWLGTPWGEQIQRHVAKKYYFDPTMEMMDRVRMDADAVYRVTAASTRIFTAMKNVEDAVEAAETAEDFTDIFLQEYEGQEVWHRFGRQLKNAQSTVATGQLAIR